jgi:hypothetical protein
MIATIKKVLILVTKPANKNGKKDTNIKIIIKIFDDDKFIFSKFKIKKLNITISTLLIYNTNSIT